MIETHKFYHFLYNMIKRLTIEQLEIWKTYYSESERQRYLITGTDRDYDSHEKRWKKVLKAKKELMDWWWNKRECKLSKWFVDNSFFH